MVRATASGIPVVVIALLGWLGAAMAAEVTQDGWAGLKQRLELPNGQAIAVVDIGDRAAPPVVLIHGYSDNSRSWSRVAGRLSAAHRLIAIDLRGHGASGAPDCCYTLPDMAYDVALVLDHLGIQRASIVGHSLGSMVAQVFAQHHPGRVGKLVLVSTVASAVELAAPGDWLWENVSGLEDPIDPDSQFMLDWYANPNPVDEDFLARERRESAAMPVKAWRGVLMELATSDYGRLASQIQAPTLVIWGGQDGFFDASSQEALKAALPASTKYRDFPELGHNLFWEKPDVLADTLLEFLE